MEVVGRGCTIRRPAGVALSAGRADACLAVDLCVVRAGPAVVGAALAGMPPPSSPAAPRPLRRGFLLGYLCGVLWYMGNCYWVRDTMLHYGDMPLFAPTLLLMGYSLVLGIYFGLFGFGVVLVRRATGSTRLALAFAPFLWARWSWPPRASPPSPGTSSATRKWITRW